MRLAHVVGERQPDWLFGKDCGRLTVVDDEGIVDIAYANCQRHQTCT